MAGSFRNNSKRLVFAAVMSLLLVFVLEVALSSCTAGRSRKLAKKAWAEMGRVEHKAHPEKELANADRLLTRAVRANRRNSDAVEARGRYHCLKNDHEKALAYFNKSAEMGNETSSLYNNRGNCYKHLDRYEDAYKDYVTALNISPRDHIINFNVGLYYHDKEDYQTALEYFNSSVMYNEDYARSYYCRGRCFRYLKQYDEALRDQRKVLSLDPGDGDAYGEMGLVYYDLDRYDKAIEAFSKAIELSPETDSWYYWKGSSCMAAERFEEAVPALKTYTSRRPEKADGRAVLAYVYHKLGLSDSAEANFNAAIKIDDKHYYTRYIKGVYHYQQEKYQDAITEYLAALSLDSSSTSLLHSIAVNYHLLDQYGKAMEYYGRILAREPDNQLMVMNLADVKADSGLYEAALGGYRKAMRMGYNPCQVYNGIARSFSKRKDYKTAVMYYDSAIVRCDTAVNYYQRKGFCLWQDKKYERAIEVYHQAIGIDSTNADNYNNLGMVLAEAGRCTESVGNYLKSIRLKPEFLYPYNNLANCYFKLGNTKDACSYWQTALDKGYKYRQEWKEEYGIDDPVDLVKKHCQ